MPAIDRDSWHFALRMDDFGGLSSAELLSISARASMAIPEGRSVIEVCRFPA